jgi:hypothetical protein
MHMLELYAERLVERERRRKVVKSKGCAPRFWHADLQHFAPLACESA